MEAKVGQDQDGMKLRWVDPGGAKTNMGQGPGGSRTGLAQSPGGSRIGSVLGGPR